MKRKKVVRFNSSVLLFLFSENITDEVRIWLGEYKQKQRKPYKIRRLCVGIFVK